MHKPLKYKWFTKPLYTGTLWTLQMLCKTSKNSLYTGASWIPRRFTNPLSIGASCEPQVLCEATCIQGIYEIPVWSAKHPLISVEKNLKDANVCMKALKALRVFTKYPLYLQEKTPWNVHRHVYVFKGPRSNNASGSPKGASYKLKYFKI